MRIVFFSPYLPWVPHTMWEITMAYALMQRGHTVNIVACSGLPDCGVQPRRLVEDADRCKLCRKYIRHDLPSIQLNVEAMQTALRPEEAAQIKDWVANLPVEELQSAEFAGLPLGEWTWPEMLNCWHTADPDLSRPEVAQSYRDFLYGAAVAAVCLPRAYARYQADTLVTLNGAFFLHRIGLETARARGMRVITHERGIQDNTLTLNANDAIWGDARLRKMWSDWKDTPLTVEELHAIHRLLFQRRRGQNMGWWAFSPTPQDLKTVREAANLPDKPMALLCTSSECEASLADRKPPVSQREWIERTVDWFRDHPEYVLVIRVHPNEGDHAQTDDRIVRQYARLKESLPDNVRLIMPEEKVSTYSLMDIATAGLTYGTTAGLEMACLGLPIVHAGMGFYKDSGFTHEISCVEDIAPTMAKVMEMPRSQEVQRLAYRFAYRYFIGLSVPFSKVAVTSDFVRAELMYQNTLELAPGRDRHLDRIVDYILGVSELYPPPSPLRALESAETETRFFIGQQIEGLLEAARQHPERIDLLVQAADKLREIGLVTDAIAVYSAALHRDPAATAAHAGLAAAQSCLAA